MKICFMCDLHLPSNKEVLQYDIMEWAKEEIGKTQPECIIFAGDVTCDGAEEVYDYFIKGITDLGIPFFYIPGNSDLRNPKTCERIKRKASACKSECNGLVIFAVNDCDRRVPEEQLCALDEADDSSIIFMHHPLIDHEKESCRRLIEWRSSHKNSMLFYGHMHRSFSDGNSVSLQAMDPDKSIGESPCITYYDTDNKTFEKSYYFSDVPTDIHDYLGISCYNPIEQIKFAIEKKLKYLELRPGCIEYENQEELYEYIQEWRKSGGENLALHFSEIGWTDGKVYAGDVYDRLTEFAKKVKADRITQHVPLVSVKEVKENSEILEGICEFIAKKTNSIEHDIVIGIENMHMTAKDNPIDARRFGYIPEECIELVKMLSGKCKHKVGINFDIGHARNNAPYSQKYQISTWLAMIGKYIVGYHIHQVTYDNGVFENHMPITDIYGHLISYTSFFKYWSEERINKAPLIFEMRPENAYEITLKTFEKYKKFNDKD